MGAFIEISSDIFGFSQTVMFYFGDWPLLLLILIPASKIPNFSTKNKAKQNGTKQKVKLKEDVSTLLVRSTFFF